MSISRVSRHDYDSEVFYQALEKFASVCFLDKDVATLLDLTPETFSAMKNGAYPLWTAEQNERRGERMRMILDKARTSSRMTARNTLLRLSVGAVKVKSYSKRGAGVHCDCKGKDKKCPRCGGTGWTIDESDIIVSETETEVAPSLQALSLWLYHHDPEFRKRQDRQAVDEDEAAETSCGVNINAWLRREMETSAEAIKAADNIATPDDIPDTATPDSIPTPDSDNA